MATETERISGLRQALEDNISGDVHFDRTHQILYSTDASNFQIEPLGVVLPREEDEISAIIEIAGNFDVPLIPRGSGSSMAGQTLGRGLIIDCSKYLNTIHAIDPESQTAVVGPGVILERLNKLLRDYGLMFGPDPASAERATLGGMMGNNATGAHSIRYGLTIDHVLMTEVALSDGSITEFHMLTQDQFKHKQASSGLEGRIYRKLAEVIESYTDEVRASWPGTWRRASGYSLNYLTGYTPNQPPVWYQPEQVYPPTAGLNLAPLMVSSEGTLSILRRATLNLVPIPKAKCLAILSFKSVAEAAEATPDFLKLLPDAIELIPRTIFQRARAIPAYARRMGFIDGDPETILVLEFSAEDSTIAARKARAISNARILDTPQAMADLWAVRKVGLGLLMSVPGDTKPITFIEDVAVPVNRLADYVRRVESVLEQHSTSGEWYAHASAGCLHLRPMVNLKSSEGVQQMRDIAEAVLDITIEMQGSISGEHGDGLSHTEYNERLFGPRLTQAFREIKSVFDPHERLNPGKVVPAKDGFGGSGSLTRDLRLGPGYRLRSPDTIFAHRREGGFASAVEACTGVGVCRQEDGLMCPSFHVTRDEIHSTRGRANILRAAMSGLLPPDSLTGDELYHVLDLCLECKGCKAECPTAVDMARIKAEFLHLYHKEHRLPLRSRLFAHIHSLSAAVHKRTLLLERFTTTRLARVLQEKLLGISSKRTLPKLSSQTFTDWFNRCDQTALEDGRQVILFVDTYTQFMQPEIGKETVTLLNQLGYRVRVVDQQVCCGRPFISKGLLDQARSLAMKNIEALARVAQAKIPILGLEPSCLLTLRDEYLEFFPGDAQALNIAEEAILIEEFLAQQDESGIRLLESWGGVGSNTKVQYHNHCHSKALVGSEVYDRVFATFGVPAFEIPSGCCGMAGSFGYEAEHFSLSQQIAELVLYPAVRQAEAVGQMVLAPGYSCRNQIKDGLGVEVLHPVQHLAQIMRKNNSA